MPVLKDRDDRYVFLRAEHVSAIVPGGNGQAMVSLRGGQTVAVAGEVEGVWKLLRPYLAGERVDITKPEGTDG